MYLKYVQIVNFKNLKTARFEFAKGANTIIGENDSGKSNALTAIRILLDDNYYYNTKRLKETDFSYALGDWRGHWIIISAFFDEISSEDKSNEFCAELTPEQENIDFLKSYIRCADKEFGTVSLFIRPCRAKRAELAEAAQNGTFEAVRSQIKLSDYEFYYTSRSQADFTDENVYKSIVGDICAGQYVNPEDDDQSVLGSKIDIMNVWQHISTVFIDALRDVESELRKPKNPIRQIIDTIEGNIEETDIDDIKRKISELNQKISHIPQVSDIGSQVNQKLLEMIGAIYSPEIKLESRLKEDFATLARYLTISPSNQKDIDLLGLGHLNILYIAMKLVEFEVNRNRELLNIMIIEEPEAHIHTHIQKTLFNNLQVTHTYTQVVMSTHSTHLSEVSDIEKVNVMNVAWGQICDEDKIILFIGEGKKTWLNIKASRAFTVALADEAHMDAADFFGIASGNKINDKFERTGYTAVKSDKVHAPVIEEFPVVMECELLDILDTEYVSGIVGRIVNVKAEEAVLSDNGKVDPAKLHALIFDQFQHGYYVTGEKVGKAWNAGAGLMKK